MTARTELIESLKRVLAYSWAKEEQDYNEQDTEGQENHIFEDLVLLSYFTDPTTEEGITLAAWAAKEQQ